MKEFIKDVKEWWPLYLALAFFISLIISGMHGAANANPCATRGRYIPLTFVMCKLSEPLE